jgi:hypothetical protein
MKKLLILLLAICPFYGQNSSAQSTTGFHRVGQVLSRSSQGIAANVAPFAKISVTSTGTGSAASIYSDPLLTAPITPPVLTADAAGNYSYYISLGNCVTETISSPGQSPIVIPNICSLSGGSTPAPPSFAVQFANSGATAFQGDSSITITPNTHTLTSVNLISQSLLAGVSNTVWSAVRNNTGNNGITTSYVDACTFGGSVLIEQNYSGTDTIPYNCINAGVGSPVQTNPMVDNQRNGQSARTGVSNVRDFGADNSGVSDSSALYINGVLPGSCSTFSSVQSCLPSLWPTGNYRMHEEVIPNTYNSQVFWRGAFPGSSHIFYNGAGGSNTYMVQWPGLSAGGFENMRFEGVNPGSTVTTMAQNFMNLTTTSQEIIDSRAVLNNFQIQNFFGDGITMGSQVTPGQILNGYFTHFRTDALGGYFLKFWSTDTADGFPIALRDYTMDNNVSTAVSTYACTAGIYDSCGGSPIRPTTNGAGDLFCDSCGPGQLIEIDNARIEENLPTTLVGNNDQGRFFFNNDETSPSTIQPIINIKNYNLAGNLTDPHPIVSTNSGNVGAEFIGHNYILDASSLYKNRTTQQEYGSDAEAQGALWSFGADAKAFQGIGLEDWLLDVIPKSSRSSNNVLRQAGDWFVNKRADFTASGGPITVVIRPTGGRGSLSSTEQVTAVGTLAINGSSANITNFSPAYIPSAATGSVHIGDWLVIANSGSGGTGSSTVQVTCVQMNSTATPCSGLAVPGVVVTPIPVCLTTSGCPTAGAASVIWQQVTTWDYGFDAKRVSSLPTAGTACPAESLTEWLTNPVAGQPIFSMCNASLQWVTGPNSGSILTNSVTFNSSGSGGASPQAFNGSAAITISYNTLGAAPTASPTFTGTVTLPGTYVVGANTIAQPSNAGTLALTNQIAVSGAGTYTTATSDAFTVTGATSSSHCTFSPTNATAAASTVVGFISAVGTNSVTISHVATTASGGTVNILCTPN